MSFTETCLDKISRVTQNPGLWYSGKRIWRFLLKQLYSLGLYRIPDFSLLNNWDGKASLHLRKGEFTTRRLWFLGYVKYDEQYFLRCFVRPGMTVIDVGANIGLISITCGLRVGSSGSVHCFEPISSTFEFLTKNINTNGLEETVSANKLAVSNKTGDIVKLVYCDKHSDLSHLSMDESERTRDYEIEYEEVATISLEDYVKSKNIKKVDFLKIDVEGAELLVIEGAKNIFKTHRPSVLCEFNCKALRVLGGSSNKLWDKWMDYGYSFFDYNHRRRTLTRCKMAPQEGAPTYVGTTNPEELAVHIGARIL